MKLIRPMPGKPELYDLVDDPMETRNLADQKPDLTRELAGSSTRGRSLSHIMWQSPFHATCRHGAPSADELKVMRGLGYVQ